MTKVNVTAEERETMKDRKGFLYWIGPGGDGLMLLFSALVLLSVTWLLERAGWEQDLPSLSGIAVASIVLGFALVRNSVRAVVSHLAAGFTGVGVTMWLAASTMAGPAWTVKLGKLTKELVFWANAVPTDGTRDGNVEFIVLLVAGIWALGYVTAWYVTHHRQPLGVIISGAVVMLVALGHLPDDFRFHFVLYIVASVVLLVHVNLLQRQREWGRVHQGYHPLEGLTRLGFVALFGLVAVLGAWKVPAVEAAPLGAAMNAGKAPFEYVQDQFSRLFAALPAKTPFVTLRWGTTLAFGSPPQLSNQVLFTVESKEPHYWRARTYDVYTYLGWRSSPPATRLLNDDLLQTQGKPESMRVRVTQSIRLNAATDTLFLAGEPVRSSLPALAVTRLNEPADVFSVRSAQDLRLSQKYTIVSSLSAATPDQLRQAGAQYPQWVSQSYLQLPSGFSPGVRRLARDVTAQAKTPYDKAIATRDYLKTFLYSLNVKAPPAGVDGVEYFLFSQKTGYCDYYASAMVAMLRSVGVPARFVVGYAAGEWDNSKKVYVVRELHYHSWVEVYFPNYGWVEFEPTPPNAVEFTNQPALNSLNASMPDAGDEAPLPEDTSPVESSGGSSATLWWSIGGGLLLAVFALTGGWYQGWGKLAKLGYAAEVYAKTCRLGSLARMGPKPYFTPQEYANYLASRMPGQKDAVKYVAEVYDRTKYSSRKFANTEEREKLKDAWRQLRPALLRAILRPGDGE